MQAGQVSLGSKISALPESISSIISVYAYKVVRKVETVMEKLSVYSTRIDDRRHLSNLDDRALRDIGLTRSDVENEINKYFWQR